MVCCSQITSNEFVRDLSLKLNKIPKNGPLKIHVIHDAFFYILKNIDAACIDFKQKNEYHRFEPFLKLVIDRIEVIESELPTYEYSYEHKRDFINVLNELRRIVNRLLF